jgi:hypothetical protein
MPVANPLPEVEDLRSALEAGGRGLKAENDSEKAAIRKVIGSYRVKMSRIRAKVDGIRARPGFGAQVRRSEMGQPGGQEAKMGGNVSVKQPTCRLEVRIVREDRRRRL